MIFYLQQCVFLIFLNFRNASNSESKSDGINNITEQSRNESVSTSQTPPDGKEEDDKKKLLKRIYIENSFHNFDYIILNYEKLKIHLFDHRNDDSLVVLNMLGSEPYDKKSDIRKRLEKSLDIKHEEKFEVIEACYEYMAEMRRTIKKKPTNNE